MRRESRHQEDKKKNQTKNILYLGGGIVIIALLAFAITYFAYSSQLNKEQTSKIDTQKIAQLIPNGTQNTTGNTQSASTQMGKSVNEVKESQNNEVEAPKIALNTSTMTKSKENENKVKQEEQKENKQSQETKEPTFAKPVEGEIVREFAKDNLIYSETLNEWTTHLGIDIKAENTTIVKAAADGKVKAIKNDPRYGLTVIIEHANGFTSCYSNLLTAEFVVEAEEVKQGQTLGTVGNSAMFEIADESHLHFEILKDGTNVDPNLYIK